jgi:hypothetical protein
MQATKNLDLNPDPQLELIGVPDDSNVKHPDYDFPTFSLTFRSFRIPFTICYNMSLK